MEMDGKNIPMLTWIIPGYNGEKYKTIDNYLSTTISMLRMRSASGKINRIYIFNTIFF